MQLDSWSNFNYSLEANFVKLTNLFPYHARGFEIVWACNNPEV